jgi:hypothetical protein
MVIKSICTASKNQAVRVNELELYSRVLHKLSVSLQHVHIGIVVVP